MDTNFQPPPQKNPKNKKKKNPTNNKNHIFSVLPLLNFRVPCSNPVGDTGPRKQRQKKVADLRHTLRNIHQHRGFTLLTSI